MRVGRPARMTHLLNSPEVAFRAPGGSSETRVRLCRRKTRSRHDTRTSLAEFENASEGRTHWTSLGAKHDWDWSCEDFVSRIRELIPRCSLKNSYVSRLA